MQFANPLIYAVALLVLVFTVSAWVKFRQTEALCWRACVITSASLGVLLAVSAMFMSVTARRGLLVQHMQEVIAAEDRAFELVARYVSERFSGADVLVVVDPRMSTTDGYCARLTASFARHLDQEAHFHVEFINLDQAGALVAGDGQYCQAALRACVDELILKHATVGVIVDMTSLTAACDLQFTGLEQLPPGKCPSVVIGCQILMPEDIIPSLEKGWVAAALMLSLEPVVQADGGVDYENVLLMVDRTNLEAFLDINGGSMMY